MCTAEDPYGTLKRLVFCREAIREARPRLVIDMGCGTGTQLTRPLAEAFPDTRFVGIDPDDASIEYARNQPTLPNLEFGGMELLGRYALADFVIASEVVEHVEEPDRFVADLRARLPETGRMIITVPNGYGPFEMATTVECILIQLRVYQAMRRVKRWLLQQPPPEPAAPRDSLAVSPHLSFFGYGGLVRLLTQSGLEILHYQPRTFLCGFGFDKIVTRFRLCDWNARIADHLPARCNSAWMFLVGKAAAADFQAFRRGALSRLRRRLNEACAGLG